MSAAGLGGRRLRFDNDILELRNVGQSAQGLHGELKDLVRRHRRSAELSRSDLDVLVLNRVLHLQER